MEKLIVILFLLVVSKNFGQQNLLYNKIWEIQSYYTEFDNQREDFFNINSGSNLIELKGASYFFVDEKTYVGARNNVVTLVGEWNLNTTQDSIQLDQHKYKITSLNEDNLIITRSGYDFGSTPETSVFITSFLEMKPATFEDITLSNNDLSNDKELEGVTLYPIPVKSDLNIQILDKKININKLTFYTLTGEEVFSKTLEDEIDDRILDVSTLNTGVYFVRFYDKKNTNLGVKRIIKL